MSGYCNDCGNVQCLCAEVARPDVGRTELLERIVRSAFAAGENWGVTYSGWFTPSKADAQKEMQRAIVNAKKIIRRSNRGLGECSPEKD